MKYFALVDCNNFYASCERCFRPELENVPIVVLSNNDGCIIARSNEAKALNIAMGTPYWEIKQLIQKHKIKVFSSNYALYGDMSARVMNILKDHCSDVEVYSIDESFIVFSYYEQSEASLMLHCQKIRKLVLSSTGIPVSIGIASTKTLSKLANHIAKKYTDSGVYFLRSDDTILEKITIDKVWGIAKGYQKRLEKIKITTVAELIKVDEQWMSGEFGVVGLRLLKELQGFPCYALESPVSSKKTVMVSRSFRRDVYTQAELNEAVSVYCTRLGEKLRKYQQSTSVLTVFLAANSFKNKRKDKRVYFSKTIVLPLATSNTNDLIVWSMKVIRLLFQQGTNYKKVGIMASELKPAGNIQTNLFVGVDRQMQSSKLMKAMDAINAKMGRNTVYFSACNHSIKRLWARKAEFESPKYTTRWEDILKVK